MPPRPRPSAGRGRGRKKPFDDPAVTYRTTKLTLPEIAALYAGKKGGSLSTLTRRWEEEGWEADRQAFWASVNAEVVKHTGATQAEREAGHLRAIQSSATILQALSGLVGFEIQRLQPQLTMPGRTMTETRAALLLRTLASTQRSIATSHVALIAAERTLMQDADAVTRELFAAFGEAHDAYRKQRDKAIEQREAATQAIEVAATVNGHPHTNGDQT